MALWLLQAPSGIGSRSTTVVGDSGDQPQFPSAAQAGVPVVQSKLGSKKMVAPGPVEAVDNKTSLEKEPSQNEQAAVTIDSSQGLRRRLTHHSGPAERTHEIKENDPLTPVRLDDAAQARIERHRKSTEYCVSSGSPQNTHALLKLQDDLTDEMVVLAQQLKESSLMMNRSLQETEKVLDIVLLPPNDVRRCCRRRQPAWRGVLSTAARASSDHCGPPGPPPVPEGPLRTPRTPSGARGTTADPPDPLRCQRDPPAAVAVLPSSLRVGLRQCDDVPCRIQCRCGRVKGLRREISDDLAGVIDSTESAVEHSLASTGRANVRAMEIYSESAKTSCFTWLIIFMMTCVFIMVVLLIRVT
ncbi:hypothetical protein Taro_000405 [Colocasia esculenta]|uniref:Uncharacterized protein n=1 Tax=Colocasia esculenta TaxID=4460 RepID=A0A843T716_COLES|nr:hypothetical protein [Colocasia esculenta]